MGDFTTLSSNLTMKFQTFLFVIAAAFASTLHAATINWSAGINHGFSLESGSELPTGALVRLGWFRDSITGQQMTDAEIQALKTTPLLLDNCFVEAGRTTIGSGFDPAIPSHFATATTINTSGSGPSLAGRQMYLWVLDAATVGAATQQAILYWNAADTTTNPDATADKPGTRWLFPAQVAFPGATTIDVTDLTVGTGLLAAGARIVVGTYPKGVSGATGMANFGLAALEQPLDVSTPSALAGGSVGVSYFEELAAVEGRPGYSWSIIGGMLPNGLFMNSEGVISGRPAFAGVFNFIVQATDATPSLVSKAFTLVIARIPLTITSAPTLPDAGLNSAYALNLTVNGGTSPYTWSVVSGSVPNGMSLSGAGLLAGTSAEAGTKEFTVKCADAGGLETTQTFSLNVQSLVIALSSTLNNAFLNIPFMQSLVAIGGKGPYNWSLSGGALPLGVNLSSAGVLSYIPDTLGSSSFTLQVEDSLGHTAAKNFTLNVLGVLVVPEVNAPLFPPAIVGEVYSHQLSASNNPIKFIAKGLPPGLTLNAKTGLISGRTKVPGVFTVKISAANAAGSSSVLDASLEVMALPTGAIGSFMGIVAHNVSVNGNLGGRLDLTTTSLGGYTLKLTQGAKISTFKGYMHIALNENPKINVTSGVHQIALSIDAESDSLVGTVTNTGVGGSSASIAGWRRVWKTGTNPANAHHGYYSMGIDLTTVSSSNPVPMGTGYASCVVGLDGGLTVVGKTADGNAITTAGFIGPNGEVLVYQVLYSKLGSLVGRLAITPDSGELYTENTIEGSLTWLKPQSVTRTYPFGFGPLTMSVYGKYLARASSFWNLTGMPNPMLPASLNFADGGVEQSAIVPDVSSFTFTNTGKVAMPTAGSVENPGRTTLVIPFIANATIGRNGNIKGTFRLVDGPLVRNVTYQGMIIRTPDNSTKAFGYFLLPQIPQGSQKPTTTPILSGQVTIQQ